MRERLAILILAWAAISAPAGPPGVNDWPFDTLKLKNGIVHKGLILEEAPLAVRFQIVRRFPGRPTVWFTCVFRHNEIEKIEKITAEDRVAVKAKLVELDPAAEARRMEKMDLKSCDWGGKKGGGLRYDSDYFSLLSDAPEEIIRRAAYRLENVYAAYAGFLPPRYRGGNPTVIRVYQSFEGYQKALPAGLMLKNPAFYDPAANRVCCGTDLQKLGEDLSRFRQQANLLLEDVAKQEAEVRRLYGKKPELNRHLQPFLDTRSQIKQAAQANELAFDQATQILFRQLYHEAFHAYVGNFVYPPNLKDTPGELPRWLNEGMAQVFETAVFEAGELRIGHADKDRLERARDLLDKKELLSIADLMTNGSKGFVVAHGGKLPDSDRAYLTAWAFASYLMFDRRVLGSPKGDLYLKAINTGGEPLSNFEKWVGQSVPDIEKGFHGWLKRLRPDGTLTEMMTGSP
ncbi:DUF1570 domain-containing protein [Zavarzinella formosa]|uniref:DUF1570 domain-containing protein n=1 Tax=Zavarzinella formosa TaxID=360055 RepID=UPI0002F06344|nr:DUF1570 domain-containing protein [Zavarzinella formosa]